MDKISRRRLLTATGGAAVMAAVVGNGLAMAYENNPRRSPWDLIVDVVTDPATRPSAAGPFVLTGRIFRGGTLRPDGSIPDGAIQIGTYTCWGWSWEPSRPTQLPGAGAGGTQSFNIVGGGELVANGILDNRCCITGGTGTFRDASGQADAVVLAPGAFRVTFDL